LIAIFGSSGNMGRRYAAICEHLGIDCIGYDIDYDYRRPTSLKITHAIIATPLSTHMDVARYCIRQRVPFLCEKPISKSVRLVEALRKEADAAGVAGYMVNNWQYVLRYPHQSHVTLYTYYSGSDGAWDYIQPWYYSTGLKVVRHPVFRVIERGRTLVEHSRESFDNSYVRMVQDFAAGDTRNLMPLTEAVLATEKISDLIWSGKDVY
jgi:hypothetical protein